MFSQVLMRHFALRDFVSLREIKKYGGNKNRQNKTLMFCLFYPFCL